MNEDLIDELNQEGYYNVIDSEGKLTVINGIRAIDSYSHQDQLDVQFLFTDLITTSVSLNVLAHIAVDIVEGLETRMERKVQFLLLIMVIQGSSDFLEKGIKKNASPDLLKFMDNWVDFSNTLVDRIIMSEDDLNVQLNSNYEWLIEEKYLKHKYHPIDEVEYVYDLVPYIERNHYTENIGKISLSYLDYHKQSDHLYECFENETISHLVNATLKETGDLLEKKYGLENNVQKNLISRSIDRLKIPNLFDLVNDPIRDIKCLVKPSQEYVEAFNAIPHALCRVIASVLMCDQERLKFMINDLGVEKTLQELTVIEDYTILFEEIIKSYERIQKSTD